MQIVIMLIMLSLLVRYWFGGLVRLFFGSLWKMLTFNFLDIIINGGILVIIFNVENYIWNIFYLLVYCKLMFGICGELGNMMFMKKY